MKLDEIRSEGSQNVRNELLFIFVNVKDRIGEDSSELQRSDYSASVFEEKRPKLFFGKRYKVSQNENTDPLHEYNLQSEGLFAPPRLVESVPT